MSTQRPSGHADEAALFERLCELSPEAQAEALVSIAHDDPAIAARLRRLLALDVAFGAHTAMRVVGAQASDPHADPRDVGPFRLLRELGRGGMGVVHLAERRDGFAQQVAIKLMPRFAADAAGRARFARERHLLAQLRHPNICSILDGGELADGTPWLAMEAVEGESLCTWCETHGASLGTRIALFLQLCDAVQYAHRNLVIHRDIKDSNVLIDAHGRVKLLDFGIAKTLTPGAADAHTAMHDLVFSPMTAAPEQIRGERGTVAIDIHALGALLHRLLTGELPFARTHGDTHNDPHAIQRAILEQVPPRISDTLQRALAKDTVAPGLRAAVTPARLRDELDAIVAHCLRKQPSERYPDVADLARDLQAWRTGHPLSVSGNDRLYRFGKFLRRHRNASLFAGVALVSVLAGLAVTGWQAGQLRQERDQARAARVQSEIDRDRARTVAAFMRDTFEQADPGRASEDTLMARDLIARGKRRLGTLDGQPQPQADLALLMAESEAGLGLLQESAATYDAHAVQIEALARTDRDVRWRAQSLQLWLRRELQADTPDLDARLAALERQADTPERQARVARERERLYARRATFGDAAKTLEDAWRRLGTRLSADDALRLRVDLGNALNNAERFEDARRVAGSIDRATLRQRDPAQQIRAWQLIVDQLDAGGADRAEVQRAIDAWRATAERFYGADSLEAANTHVWAVGASDDPATQASLMQRAYAIQTAKLPPVSMARAYVEFNMASYFLELRHSPAQAEPHFAQAVTLGRRVSSRGHGDVRKFELRWARVLNTLGRHAECLDLLASPPGAPEGRNDAKSLSALELELAIAAHAVGQPARARTHMAEAEAVWRQRGEALPAPQADILARLSRQIGGAVSARAAPGRSK